MLDIKFIRQNPQIAREAVVKKGFDVDVDQLLRFDDQYRAILAELESMRARQNEFSKKIAQLSPADREQGLADMKVLSADIAAKEEDLKNFKVQLDELMLGLPNLPIDDVPVGADESGNIVVKTEGEKPQFDFEPKDHESLGKLLDLIDIERAAKTSGSRFSILKNQLVMLEFALVRFALEILQDEGFTSVIVPQLVNERTMLGAGYLSQGEDEIYKTQDDLYLIGTSEQAIAGMHQDEVLDEKDLPKKYAGFSTCFRREAGSYGKDVKGILRQHQFDKVEMFVFCAPEKSKEMHQYLVGIEERIVRELGLPYRLVRMCTGDLGLPAADKYDIECFMSGQNQYRETHSCSHCTDFQARRLNIRMKSKDGKVELLHTLNGTAVAIGRMLIAIIENCQQKDASIVVPKVLVPYCGFEKIERKLTDEAKFEKKKIE